MKSAICYINTSNSASPYIYSNYYYYYYFYIYIIYMSYSIKKKVHIGREFIISLFFMAKTSGIFLIGGRVRPQNCYFLLFLYIFSVKKR
jgi:hypothetical protein